VKNFLVQEQVDVERRFIEQTDMTW